MSKRDPAELLAEVRDLTRRAQGGGEETIPPFRDLLALLLHCTVLKHDSFVTINRFGGRARAMGVYALGGPDGPDDPLPLNDDRYLRLAMRLYVAPTREKSFLKVESSSYQYQIDRDGRSWVFRYDYTRRRPSDHPTAHVHINGTLEHADVLPTKSPLARVHFPTGRISVEAVIQLLVEHFNVSCNEPRDVWRPLLIESERAFISIAHRPPACGDADRS